MAKTESPSKRIMSLGPDARLPRMVRVLLVFCLPALALLILPSPAVFAAGPAGMMDHGLYLLSALLQPSASADLEIEKVDIPDPVVAGQGSLTYFLIVSNHGPDAATSVTVTDPLPPEVIFVSALATQGSCDEDGGTVTCQLGNLAFNASAYIQIVVTVPPSVVGTLTNMATVSAIEIDPDLSNNQDSEPTTVLSIADLAITKTDSPDPVTPGETLTYEVVVYNAGPSDAYGVVVEDLLPPEVTFLSATPPPASSPNPLVWGPIPIAAGQASTFTVQVQVAPDASGVFTNTATVTTTSLDPDPSNNQDQEPTTAGDPVADLSVVKTDNPDPVGIGDLLTYTLTVHNAGPSNAAEVVVTDTLPAEVTFVSADPAPVGTDPLEWELGPMSAGETAVITVVVQVGPAAYQSLSNVAWVAGAATDPNAGNNEDTEPTAVLTPIADLSIAKEGTPGVVVAGERLTYTLSIYNAGPAYAHDVLVVDTLPAEVIFVSSDPPPTSGPNPLTWDLGIIPVAESRVITVLVDVAPSAVGTLTNTATVSAASIDPEPGDNQAEAVTEITTLADVSISKTDDPDPVVPGELLNYTLTILNDGPSDAQDVVVSDTLPTEVLFVSANPPPTGGPDPLTWELGTVAAGTSLDIAIVVQVPSSLTSTQSLTNIADVSTTSPDPVLQNNHDEEQTAVAEPSADLALTKSDSSDPVEPGTLLTYTLVVQNLGPSDAVGVVLNDTLPPEVSFVSAVPPQDSGPNPLTWNVGNLAAGEGVTVNVVVQVHEWVVTPFTNGAAVSASTADPNPANNSADELTWPDVEVSLSLQKSAEPAAVVPGMPFTYVLRITNTGEVTFDSLVLTDTLPAGFVYSAGSGVPSEPDLVAEPLLVWANLGPLAPGAGLEVSFTATPPPDPTGTYTNTATVRGATVIGEARASDEAALLFTTPQVAVRKSLTGIEMDAHAPNYITFTITITNVGPSPIDALSLVDSYDPYYLSFVSATPAPDEATDDGSVGWLDLTGPAPHGFGRALAPGETFVVEATFMVAHEIVSSTLNLALVTDGTDIYGNAVPMSADSEEVVGIPTAVELLYFRASQEGDRVVLEWESAWETDNWGFNLYRSPTRNLANAELIHFELGQGHGQFEGQFYTYEDLDAGDQVMYYWLEDVTLGGAKILLAGPVTPRRATFRVLLPIVHK
ncbi:MAG: DUF11 domain-containing protein [Anaerolineae bacterium]|nr:DUF11 domain-containing protein [Anaerolineae bacterium]